MTKVVPTTGRRLRRRAPRTVPSRCWPRACPTTTERRAACPARRCASACSGRVSRPKSRSTTVVTMAGVTYRVVQVDTDPAGAAYTRGRTGDDPRGSQSVDRGTPACRGRRELALTFEKRRRPCRGGSAAAAHGAHRPPGRGDAGPHPQALSPTPSRPVATGDRRCGRHGRSALRRATSNSALRAKRPDHSSVRRSEQAARRDPRATCHRLAAKPSPTRWTLP